MGEDCGHRDLESYVDGDLRCRSCGLYFPADLGPERVWWSMQREDEEREEIERQRRDTGYELREP